MAEDKMELVETGNGLDLAERRLEGLVEQGDSSGLSELAAYAAAEQEYATRKKAATRAAYCGSVKVMAEAGLGTVDLRLHPSIRQTTFEVGGVPVASARRTEWRLLAFAKEKGLLEPVLERLASEEVVGVTTHSVIQELRALGVSHIATKQLRAHFDRLCAEQGLNIRQLADRMGRDAHTVGAQLGIYKNGNTTSCRQKTCRYETARTLALAMGVDPVTLDPVPHTWKRRPTGRKMRAARKLNGGRLDKTYTLIRQALAELDGTAGASGKWGTAEAYEHLYAAEDIIGKALRRAT